MCYAMMSIHLCVMLLFIIKVVGYTAGFLGIILCVQIQITEQCTYTIEKRKFTLKYNNDMDLGAQMKTDWWRGDAVPRVGL